MGKSLQTLVTNNILLKKQPSTTKSLTYVINPVQLSNEASAARKSDIKFLPSFDGTPKNWPTFHHQFHLSSAMCQFEDVDNIIRLRTSLKGKALKAVHGALAHPERVNERS